MPRTLDLEYCSPGVPSFFCLLGLVGALASTAYPVFSVKVKDEIMASLASSLYSVVIAFVFWIALRKEFGLCCSGMVICVS